MADVKVAASISSPSSLYPFHPKCLHVPRIEHVPPLVILLSVFSMGPLNSDIQLPNAPFLLLSHVPLISGQTLREGAVGSIVPFPTIFFL